MYRVSDLFACLRRSTPSNVSASVPPKETVNELINELDYLLFMGALSFERFDAAFLATDYGRQYADCTIVDRLTPLRTALLDVAMIYWIRYCDKHNHNHRPEDFAKSLCCECEWQITHLIDTIAAGTSQVLAVA